MRASSLTPGVYWCYGSMLHTMSGWERSVCQGVVRPGILRTGAAHGTSLPTAGAPHAVVLRTAQCIGLSSPAYAWLGWLGGRIPPHAVEVSPNYFSSSSRKRGDYSE